MSLVIPVNSLNLQKQLPAPRREVIDLVGLGLVEESLGDESFKSAGSRGSVDFGEDEYFLWVRQVQMRVS